VEQPVMAVTHQPKVGPTGTPSPDPVVEVVDITPLRGAVASRELTVFVGQHHRAPQRRRRGAHGAAEVKWVAGADSSAERMFVFYYIRV
jgi:hypothetical protein